MSKAKNEAEIRVRVRRNPRKFWRNAIVLTFATYLIVLGYGLARNSIIGNLAKVEQVREGVIQTTFPAKGILVRSEKLVVSPRSGILKVLAVEGERVRVGQIIAQVVIPALDTKSGERVFNINAPQAGVVSFQIDGLEEILSAANLRELDLNKIDTIKSEPRRYQAGGQVEQGKPVLKIFNNLVPVSIITTAPAASLPSGSRDALVYFGSTDQDTYRAQVVERKLGGNSDRCLLSLARYDSRLITTRQVEFQIIAQRYEGLVIPTKAVVKRDGLDGIYIVYKERAKWKEIKVIGRADNQAVISGVTPDVKIVLNPEYVREGTVLK